MPLTFEEFTMGREEQYPLSPELEQNANELIEKINELEQEYLMEGGGAFILTSGYRPSQINAGITGSKPGDAHTTCRGIDLHDNPGGPSGCLSKWLLANLDILEDLGLWMEAPQSAVNHVHIQSYPPGSGKRVFIA